MLRDYLLDCEQSMTRSRSRMLLLERIIVTEPGEDRAL